MLYIYTVHVHIYIYIVLYTHIYIYNYIYNIYIYIYIYLHHLLPTGEVGIYMAIILSSVCVCGKQISQLSESIWISHPRASAHRSFLPVSDWPNPNLTKSHAGSSGFLSQSEFYIVLYSFIGISWYIPLSDAQKYHLVADTFPKKSLDIFPSDGHKIPSFSANIGRDKTSWTHGHDHPLKPVNIPNRLSLKKYGLGYFSNEDCLYHTHFGYISYPHKYPTYSPN